MNFKLNTGRQGLVNRQRMEIACEGSVDVVRSVFGVASCCVTERKRGEGSHCGHVITGFGSCNVKGITLINIHKTDDKVSSLIKSCLLR